jgi:hypothetical protein
MASRGYREVRAHRGEPLRAAGIYNAGKGGDVALLPRRQADGERPRPCRRGRRLLGPGQDVQRAGKCHVRHRQSFIRAKRTAEGVFGP